ncbi:small multi-drug export protein [Elusimicrobiota bacterium]
MKDTIKEKINPFWSRLIASPEGVIFIIGLILAFFYILILGIMWILAPKNFQIIVGITATHIVFGRAAALSFAYTMGLGHSAVIPVSMLIETILVTIMFPLFVFIINRLVVIKSLNVYVERIHNAAQEKRELIRKYGIIGLFLFVWFPFWMTGPIIGSVIGYLIGFKPWANISIVLGGTYLAISIWAVFLRVIHDKIAAYNPFVPIIMLIVIVILAIIGNLLNESKIKQRKKQKQQ